MQRRRALTLSASALAAAALAPGARAQSSYPDRPITMVVPAPPGGGTDIVARLFAEPLSQELGQQVIVDNKGGGNGNVGTATVARAKPDGYTLLMQYNGTVKALALASDQRHPAFADIPTTAEAGLPGFKLDGWFALFAPVGTPQPIIDKLNAAMRKVAGTDSAKQRANQLGTVLVDWSPAEMDAFARKEVADWGKVIRDNNITID